MSVSCHRCRRELVATAEGEETDMTEVTHGLCSECWNDACDDHRSAKDDDED